jgi:hypothetical protein
MKISYTIFLFISVAILHTFSGCLNNKEEPKQITIVDGVQPDTLTQKSETTEDGSSLVILSTKGEVIKTVSWKYDTTATYMNDIKGYPDADTITGDFNGDGKKELAWFEDAGVQAFEDCMQNSTKKSCEGIILFSDKNIPPLKIDYCPMYKFRNEGDLYGNGKDAIGVLPGWFNSDCRQYAVFTFKTGKWQSACEPISNSLNMREAGIQMIESIPEKNGWAVIRESVDSYTARVKNHAIAGKYIALGSCQWSHVVEQIIKLK